MNEWWQDAVVYQVYVRSFADGDGDGTGDVAGLRSRLPYLERLGVDALWVNPWYLSPLADGGYDVADYRRIDPRFGTVEEVEALIADAHTLGIRVIADIVPNHTSTRHAWFQQALSDGPGSAARERYWFRPGRGPDGDEPPNDWFSVFGQGAWERVTEPDGSPGEWYLHLFDTSQPDLNWQHPDVRREFLDVLRFWFDRGIDGFRIDVAHGLVKDPALPDLGVTERQVLGTDNPANHPHWDRDDVHEIFREWRSLADSYDPPRTFVGEVWVDDPERLAMYRRPDELHGVFDFDFAKPGWDAGRVRAAVDTVRAAAGSSPATWVLSNHDVARHVTRFGIVTDDVEADSDQDAGYGSPNDAIPPQLHAHRAEVDVERGRRRARAMALLELALPGSAYVYQGDELGLDEVLDLPDARRDDPVFFRTEGELLGRDGCRVPLPWEPSGPSLGFGSGEAWLPQPESWAALAASAQEADPRSMLWLYRHALRLRRELTALGAGEMEWGEIPGRENVLVLRREPGFTCIVNFDDSPVPLPADSGEVVLATEEPTHDGLVAPESAAWLVK